MSAANTVVEHGGRVVLLDGASAVALPAEGLACMGLRSCYSVYTKREFRTLRRIT